MEEGSLSSLTLILVLAVLHGLVALAYAALTYSPKSFLRDQAEEGNKRASRVLRLNEELPRLQITAHLALMLLRVSIFTLAAVEVAQPLITTPAEVRLFLVPMLGYVAVLLPLTLLIYCFADLIPMAIGRAKAETIAPVAALPFRVVVVLFSPLVALFMAIDSAVSRVSGGSDIAKTVTDEEILTLVDVGQKGGMIETEEKEMIRSVLEFGETLVREVMVPRPDIKALDIDSNLEDALGLIVESGHSRVPVYEESIDNVKGILYAKDLLNSMHRGELATRSIRELMRPGYFVPETKRADTLFKEMRVRKVHLAVVVDEYGGTAGLVTIEDLVEEIVGDIQDEYDLHEEAEYVQHGADEYTFDASMNLDDFNEMMDSDLSTEDSDTLGGYVFSRLGRVPEPGEIIEEDRLTLRVEAVEGRRIRKIHVTRKPEEPGDDDHDEAHSREKSRAERSVGDPLKSAEVSPKPAQ